MRGNRILAALALSAAFPAAAMAGGVKLDMPAPRKAVPRPDAVVSTSAAATTVADASVATPDVGDVALHRYANARRGTYDNYDSSFGIPRYGYPYGYNTGYWGGWGLGWGWGWWGSSIIISNGCHSSCHSRSCSPSPSPHMAAATGSK